MKTLDQQPEVEVSLRTQALDDLQRAWKAIRRMETVSNDQAEVRTAERALSFVDKAFAELEQRGKR